MYTIAKLNVSLISIAGVSACLASTSDLYDWDNAFDRQRVRIIHFTREENRIEDFSQYLNQKNDQIIDLEDMNEQVNRYFKDNNIQNNLESIQEKAEQLANEYFDLLVKRKIIYEAPQPQPVILAENNPVIQAAPAEVEERQEQALIPVVHPAAIQAPENNPVIQAALAEVEERQEQALIPVVHPAAIQVPENNRVIEERFADVDERQEPVTAIVIDHHEDVSEPSEIHQTSIDPTIPEDIEPSATTEVHPKRERIYLDPEQTAETQVISALASYMHVIAGGVQNTSFTSNHMPAWPTLFEGTWNSIYKGESLFHPLILSLRQQPLDNNYKDNFRFTISQQQNEGLGIATPSKNQTSFTIPITASVLPIRDSAKFSYEGIPLSAFNQIKLSDSQILSANNSLIINIIDKLIGYISFILSNFLKSNNSKHHNEGV